MGFGGPADEAARYEGELLDEYVVEHLESPPLNYSSSWRHNISIVQPADDEEADWWHRSTKTWSAT